MANYTGPWYPDPRIYPNADLWPGKRVIVTDVPAQPIITVKAK